MNVLRIGALVFSTWLFFPVSCTTGLIAGTSYFSLLDARDMAKGDKPHEIVYLIASLPENRPNILFDGKSPSQYGYSFASIPNSSAKFVAFPLYSLEEFQKINQPYSFVLPIASGEFSVGSPRPSFSFTATSSVSNEQIVEVTMRDDTGTFFRYAATQHTIKPLYTKLWYHGYMFAAFPYALAFAATVMLLGKWLRRRLDRHMESKNIS